MMFILLACSDYGFQSPNDDDAQDQGADPDTGDIVGDDGGTESETDDPSAGDPVETPVPTDFTIPDDFEDEDDFCDHAKGVDGFLDAFQQWDDGKVLYCHSGSGSNWVLVNSDISSCLSHMDHDYDVFPTSLCGT